MTYIMKKISIPLFMIAIFLIISLFQFFITEIDTQNISIHIKRTHSFYASLETIENVDFNINWNFSFIHKKFHKNLIKSGLLSNNGRVPQKELSNIKPPYKYSTWSKGTFS